MQGILPGWKGTFTNRICCIVETNVIGSATMSSHGVDKSHGAITRMPDGLDMTPRRVVHIFCCNLMKKNEEIIYQIRHLSCQPSNPPGPRPSGKRAPNSSAKMGRLCENQVQLHWHQTHPQKKDCSHLTHHAQPLQQTSTPPDRWIVLLKCGEFFWTLVLDAHHSITWTFWDSFTNSFQFYKSHCIS